jgi:tRNA (guanine37-N1)-methyltransferase
MILMIEPIYSALLNIYPEMKDLTLLDWKDSFKQKYPNHKIVLMDPKGKRYIQATAQEYSKIDRITFICGRYEGVDERVAEYLATDCISIGDFVLAGGELPALTIMESITRLIPGALEKEEAVQEESFTGVEAELEYPQYTRPEDFKGVKVPDILLSGHHKNITDWRKQKRNK